MRKLLIVALLVSFFVTFLYIPTSVQSQESEDQTLDCQQETLTVSLATFIRISPRNTAKSVANLKVGQLVKADSIRAAEGAWIHIISPKSGWMLSALTTKQFICKPTKPVAEASLSWQENE